MGKGLGYARLTIPGRPELGNQPVVIQIGGELLEDIIEAIKNTVATKANASDLDNKANNSTVALKANLSVIAPTYSTTSTYSEGDVVNRSSKIYVCNTDIETAGAFDESKWTETTVAALIASSGSSE